MERRTVLRNFGVSSIGALYVGSASSAAAASRPGNNETPSTSYSPLDLKADGHSDDAAALQAAIDHALSGTGPALLTLPAGEIHLSRSLLLRTQGTERPDREQLIIQGAGSGENGTWLHFASGSLVVTTPNHVVRDLRVTSRDSDGIVIRPDDSGAYYPSRGMLGNVRAEYCARSGIIIEDCWVYSLFNCHARFNRHVGLEGRSGKKHGIACNALTIVGGEFQGNGTKSPGNRGSGAGIITGRCVQFSMTGGAIEGNLGDGIVLSKQLRGFSLTSVYFEKNGTHADNYDITTDHIENSFEKSGDGANSGWILNCNFTPQANGAGPQNHALELVNVRDLRIINPQFYGQAGNIYYAEEPIRISETEPGRSTGWVEGGYFSSSAYTQDLVRNETARFGIPRTHRFSPEPGAQRAAFCVPLLSDAAERVEVRVLSRGAQGDAQISIGTRFGSGSKNWSVRTEKVSFDADETPILTHRRVASAYITQPPSDFIEVQVSAADGPRKNAVHLMSVEIITYEARMG